MSVESWKSLCDIVAVIAALVTFFAGAGALYTGRIINEKQDGKLRQFSQDLKDKDVRIAELNKATEDERTERVKLQERVAWRTISPSDIAAIGSRLSAFRLDTDSRVAIGTVAGNEEAVSFSEDLASVIVAAGWTFLGVAPYGNLGQQRFGLRISTTRDHLTTAAAQSLKQELDALGFNPSYEESDNVFASGGAGIYLHVELRPRLVTGKTSAPKH